MRKKQGDKLYLAPRQLMLLCCPLWDQGWASKACPASHCRGSSPFGKAPRWGCTSPGVICSSRTPLLAYGRRARRGNGCIETGKKTKYYFKSPEVGSGLCRVPVVPRARGWLREAHVAPDRGNVLLPLARPKNFCGSSTVLLTTKKFKRVL